MILAGDAGATKTELSVFDSDGDRLVKVFSKIYKSKGFHNFEDLLIKFSNEADFDFESGSIGIPAPVFEGKAKATNLNWEFDEKEISKILKIKKFKLVNDLEALAKAVIDIQDENLIEIYKGNKEDRQGNKGILAPGTGLGQAALIFDGDKYITIPTEGGHTDFGPNSEIESELYKFLNKKFGHVSYEKVASGMGIVNIFEFLISSGHGEVNSDFMKSYNEGDKTQVITDEALKNKNTICLKTLDIFLSVLGSQAGNMVLNYKATGGIYLGGGIPVKLSETFRESNFTGSYLSKGKLSYLPERTSVSIINNPSAGTLGAAAIAAEL